MSASEGRLETLEFKLMELENTVAELNDVVIRQYREIDSLKAAQSRLLDQIDTMNRSPEGKDGADATHELPPHY